MVRNKRKKKTEETKCEEQKWTKFNQLSNFNSM
jgi:hypothetical protein